MKCLQLNSTYEPMSFIDIDKALKLYFRYKIEVISNWDEKITWINGSMKLPAIIKLNKYVRHIRKRTNFDRHTLFRRDLFCCGYCNRALSANSLTVDHIVPKSQGGLTTWLNCVSACGKCNSYKQDRTPEQANMQLLIKPTVPTLGLKNDLYKMQKIHDDWANYIK
jgi:5-methylcytosine-specific restriction endonuclease McrA